MSMLAHTLAVFGFILFSEVLWTLERFQVRSTLLGLLSVFAVQRFIFKSFVAIFLTRELHHDATNRAWWSGRWGKSHVSIIFHFLIHILIPKLVHRLEILLPENTFAKSLKCQYLQQISFWDI